MTPWSQAIEPKPDPISLMGWLRVLSRAAILIVLVFGCLLLLLLVRLIEWPICGLHRPVTPHITQFVCRNALRVLRIPLNVAGQPLQGQAAVVANHTSWLDIFVLNASKRIYFVSKSEVAGWPGIGWLARATGTLFIKRERSQAHAQTKIMQARLLAGHKLLFFPEGTSTDGQQVLPFKTTLFASFMAPELRDTLQVQPVSVVYHAPEGEPKEFYGWWGDMEFATNLISTLATRRQGSIDVIYHPALKVADFADRKALARAAEMAVRVGHTQLLDNSS
jgi:1-acyl-sn-glycerol-3-phosphate acyltransferase|tara:strand:- start:98 stop:931 length:834 start_codon:yes stop_codon:yes gene_type:complete